MKKSELKQLIGEVINEANNNKFDLDVKKLKHIKVGGVNMKDYPHFVDAFIESAEYPIIDKNNNIIEYVPLSSEELNWLTDNYPILVNDLANEKWNENKGY